MTELERLIAQRDALRRNRADGVRQYRDQNGEEITYRSDRELMAALAAVEEEIARHESGRVHTVKLTMTKGL